MSEGQEARGRVGRTCSRSSHEGLPPSSPSPSPSPSPSTLSYRDEVRQYRREKCRVAQQLLGAARAPAPPVHAGWLKVRGTLRGWSKLWCELRPGLLLLYKTEQAKRSHWVGTILLTSCRLIERPSRRQGFCFKLFHPLERRIWSTRGPDGETVGAVVPPLPQGSLIFRSATEGATRSWLHALELCMTWSPAAQCARQVTGTQRTTKPLTDVGPVPAVDEDSPPQTGTGSSEGVEEDEHERMTPEVPDGSQLPPETPYVEQEPLNLAGRVGHSQTQELADELKSLVWTLMKQLRPGMDVSRIKLPTSVFEPLSFLVMTADCANHADCLSRAAQMGDPYVRMKGIVEWYFSMMCQKTMRLKIPYKPIIGETFRCFWKHPNGSRTYYFAEQISRHPWKTAAFISNRPDDFCIFITASITGRFYGNSAAAVPEGTLTVRLLSREEEYHVTLPHILCKSLLIGTVSLELGGKAAIECPRTGYVADLEFKLKSMWAGPSDFNKVAGRIRLGQQTLATIDGKWDGDVFLTDKHTNERELLWSPTPETRARRLPRFTVPLEEQAPHESERLWLRMSEAIQRQDQTAVAEERFTVMEAQREAIRNRAAAGVQHTPKYFDEDPVTGRYTYRYACLRPWDPCTELSQYEAEYRLLTQRRAVQPPTAAGAARSGTPGQAERTTVGEEPDGLKLIRPAPTQQRSEGEKTYAQAARRRELSSAVHGSYFEKLLGSSRK
ncbi:oxysterol-binding protein-related protein 5-like [Pollicipes pollicipes]|uniref:oxysterol-binding protein-related protein 5-like n=1 Tax=Pollicipes pollicipes TaxID=41117 RepID=UPI00188576C6|nr:oxysterol-binding protein-related protein 5-like [Pollicipes pollicipes]